MCLKVEVEVRKRGCVPRRALIAIDYVGVPPKREVVERLLREVFGRTRLKIVGFDVRDFEPRITPKRPNWSVR